MRSARSDYKEFSENVEELESPGALTQRPNVNNIQCILYEEKYRRAKVVDIDFEGICDLFLIDHGVTLKKVNWIELKQLSYRRRNVPKQTRKVHMKNVENIEITTQEMQDYFGKLKSEILKVANLVARRGPLDSRTFVVLERSNGEIVNRKIEQLTENQREETMEEGVEDDEIDLNYNEYDEEFKLL